MRLKFKWIYTLLLALSMQFSFAQEKTVSGVVSDGTGPVPGANVIVKGTKNGVQTDFDGKYSIKAKTGDVLVVSFVGMQDATSKVGSSNSINFKLQQGNTLDEVVVVGYGTQKKKEVTGSQSTVSGKDIANLVTPSFEGQLAGRASGVQITTSNGIVGQAPRIRIRGIASISSGTYPLIVVDGMPIVTGDIGGVANTNSLADINPADIESMDVLKDGAATAIYGSRAANGVILITTKTGKKGTLKVNISSSLAVASPFKKYDLLETPDFLTISNEKRTNRGQAPWAIGNTYNTDWQSAVLRAAPQINHSLSFSGGSDKTKYYLSIGATDQTGITLSNDMKRYSVRANIDQDINKWLSVGTNLSVTRTEYNGLNTGTTSLSGNIFNATRQLPNTPIYDATNATGYNLTGNTVGKWQNTDPVGDNIPNIMYVLNNNKYVSKVNRTLASIFANAKLTSDLTFRVQASVDNSITGGFQYLNPVHGDGSSINGYLYNDNTEYLVWNWQNILSYKKTIAENHNIGATLVSEYQKQKYQNFWGSGSDLLSSFYNQNLVSSSYATKDSGGSVTENGIISYLGRFNYNFKEKYFIQASVRRDGISKLGQQTRWNNFPGASVGWTVSKENFMSKIKAVSDLKLRASYSNVGNTDIGNYPYLGLTTSSPYGPLNGIAYSQFGNDALKWESSKKIDFGAELGLFNNRLNLTFDYYKNDIDNLILAVPTAPSLAIPNNTINKNIGKLYNKGYEFSASFKAINKENMTWDLSANVTLSKNQVTNLYLGQDILYTNNIIREGEALNSLYGFEYWGVNKANGNPVYYKADGSLVQGNIANSSYYVFDPNNPSVLGAASSLSATTDRKILGNVLPTYFGSVISKFTYKQVDFGFMFRFSGGNKIFNSTRRDLMNQNFNNNSTEILGRWQSASSPGDGWTPRLWASGNTFVNLTGNATSRFVEDGSFISLDNVSLGYSLPKSVTEKIKIDNFRIYIQGQNLMMITKYKGLDPEMESAGVDLNGTPRSKIISMGINVSL
jgi:TonB-linked SusC/RagA family outer membrane protein